MSTPNINLNLIDLEDTIHIEMLRKLNENMEILDAKYGELKNELLKNTDKETLTEAISYIPTLVNELEFLKQLGNASSSEIAQGKTAVVQGNLVTGTGGVVIPQVSITLTGTNASYISAYGYGFDINKRLVIWAKSNSSSYEHIYFVASNIIGPAEYGWGISSFDTGDPTEVPHACTVTGLENYTTLNITLNASAVNTSYDRVQLDVTITN